MTDIATPSRSALLHQPVAGDGYRWRKLLREACQKWRHQVESFFQLAADTFFSHKGQAYRDKQAAQAIRLFYRSQPESRSRKKKRREPVIPNFVRALVSYALEGKTAQRPRFNLEAM